MLTAMPWWTFRTLSTWSAISFPVDLRRARCALEAVGDVREKGNAPVASIHQSRIKSERGQEFFPDRELFVIHHLGTGFKLKNRYPTVA
jgi:hypothetical protein